jgi:CubicO group peptidase (beta-lactamase class C family)
MAKKALFLVIALLACLLPNASYAQQTAPDQQLLAQIDEYVARQFQQNDITGGAYAIVSNGEVIAANGIGVADLQTREPVTPQTVYSTASVTKAFTAAAILHLYEQGAIELDAPVQRYIPWFTYKDAERSAKVTIRHLLTHSPGIERFTADGSIFQNEKANRNSLENGIRALSTVDMVAEPGTQGAYCNTCYNVLGLVIEQVTQTDYEQYMHKALFQPLGLEHTSFDPSNAASEYNWVFGRRNKSAPNNHIFGESQNPEGGIYSNVLDLSTFLSAMMEDDEQTYLSHETLRMSHKGEIDTGSPDTKYALSGFEETTLYGTRILYKAGDGIGSSAMIVMLPEQKIGISILAGDSVPEFAEPLVHGIVALLLGETPQEVQVGTTFWKLVGLISLGFTIIGLIMLAMLVRSIVKMRNGAKPTRRWWLICRIVLCTIIFLPLSYLMISVHPTQIGFYGYPYDLACGFLALIVPSLLWVVYSIMLLFVKPSKRAGAH